MNNRLKIAIKAEIQYRNQRAQALPSALLGEPAWDILLDLAAAKLENKRIQITAIGLNEGLPPTTALRWIGLLVEHNLIRRIPDDVDRRRTWLEITPEAMKKVAACFGLDCETVEANALVETVAEREGNIENRSAFFGVAQRRVRDIEGQLIMPRMRDKPKPRHFLLERATDWTRQDYEQRLSASAQALYIHGYLSAHEYRRIEWQLEDEAELARLEAIKSRR